MVSHEIVAVANMLGRIAQPPTWGGPRANAGGPRPGSGPKRKFKDRKVLAVNIEAELLATLDRFRGSTPRGAIVAIALERYLK